MSYINTETGAYPVTESEIRAANSNTSFPTPFRAPEEYVPVFPSPQPAYDAVIRTAREIAPVLTPKGHYEQAWEVVPRFAEHTDDEGVVHTVAEQEAAAIAADQTAKAKTLQESVVAATQQRLDTFARTRNYDGILSACTYATSTVSQFAVEGQYAVQVRDATWAALYQILAEAEAGTRPVPASFDDVQPLLPALEWPNETAPA